MSLRSARLVTKGVGAGGANTNASGLPYEALTDLNTEYNIQSNTKHSRDIIFRDDETRTIFRRTEGAKFFKCMAHAVDTNVGKSYGCKHPDEVYINEVCKRIFIIEKKFQEVGGSACEKIQTADFKVEQYSDTFPGYEIVYIYCLSDFFKKGFENEFEYYEEFKQIEMFWGSDVDYKKKIIDFICNYGTD